MNLTRAINILNKNNFGEEARLIRNGYVWESRNYRFNVITQKNANEKEVCLWINMDKLDGSDKDIRCDYNNTIQIKTISELKKRIENEPIYNQGE